MTQSMTLRDCTPTDFKHVLTMNEIEVEYTSPMDLARISELDSLSSYHKVADIGDSIAGFLLAFDHNAQYRNDNFDWFASRYPKFMYIDRIVIDQSAKGQGVGRQLYQDLFTYSQSKGIPVVGCEYNLKPLNQASVRFHKRMGFDEVGTREYKENGKVVSMQIKALAG